MRSLIKTEADALALIAATHSGQRPDIHEPLAPGEWRAWDEMIHAAPATSDIARFYLAVVDMPTWDPEIHLEDLEGYHYDNLSEEEADARQEALRQGAPLTEEEKEVLATVWEDSFCWSGVKVYYLYRVGPPFATSDEARSIYFLCLYSEGGQYSDLESVTGPLRSLDEVLALFPAEIRNRYEFDEYMTEGEGEEFKIGFLPPVPTPETSPYQWLLASCSA